MRAEAQRVAEEVEARLAAGPWDPPPEPTQAASAAAEVATFALGLSGKRRTARRLRRLVAHFALAACVALTSVAAACAKPDAGPEATQTAISQLQPTSGTGAIIGQAPRASPARFTDLVLVDPGSDSQPWAVLLPKSGSTTPVLVDRAGAGLSTTGATYDLPAQPIGVGTRDGPSQFLEPLAPAAQTAAPGAAPASQGVSAWAQDERFLAPTRAIAGQPTVLDAAYNAAAAVAAGGTHTYLNGVVLRVDPDNPVLEVIDQALLQSGVPTRAEDVVHVAIRGSESALYEPGQVVNLRDVVMDQQQTDVNGQSTTVYVANAALDGARVEPTGQQVDLQSLLQPRLQRVNQDLAAQGQDQGAAATPGATLGATPAATATPQPTARPGATAVQPVIINNHSGPSFVDDFLIWMLLTHSGWYRGPSVVIASPQQPTSYPPVGSAGYYYSPPPAPTSSSPTTPSAQQAAARSTALQASRTAISGQAAGTGGGTAATSKGAADASAQASAATTKAASVAGQVSAASAGKSISSAPASSSSTASRSAGSTAARSTGSSGSSGSSSSGSGSSASSSSRGSAGSSSSSSGTGFGGKGISGGSTGSSA